MVKRKIEWFEAKTIMECVICGKDIEIGDHYCLNDTGEPMHYYCYNVSNSVKGEGSEKQTDSEESEGGNNGGKGYVVSESGIKVFSEYQDNISIDKDNPALKKKAEYLREKYTRGKVKGFSRLGSENSEDARSWNLFRTLQLRSDMQKYYGLIRVQDNPQNLLFWGLDPQTGEFDGVLKSVLDEIEPPHLWKVQQTEPDVIVIGQKTVVFNECKLGKPGANIDAWNRKEPFTGKHELYKRSAQFFFRQLFIENFEAEARRFYQLMRNYIMGEHFASRLSKVFHLVAIASAQNKASSGLPHEEEFNKFCSYLFDSSRCHFLTLEQLEEGCHP